MDVTKPLSVNATCRDVGQVLSRIGEKWTILVLIALRKGPLRFNEMKRQVGGISQQMLTRTLKALERDGLLTRTVHATAPPQVDYALTALGTSLAETMRHVGQWALVNVGAIQENRQHFDARISPDAQRAEIATAQS